MLLLLLFIIMFYTCFIFQKNYGMFRNHQFSVFRVLSTVLNVNSIKQQSSSQNVHKQLILARELLFLSQLITTSIYTKNSLLQTLHWGKMNRKKMWFCKRFSGNKVVLSWLFILCESLNSLNFRVTLISRFFLYREIRENNTCRENLL